MRDLMLPQPFLKPFPVPEEVFVDPVERYARHLHPLVSIELSAAYPDLSGLIHLVSPIEPYEGYLGDSGEQAWGPYLQPNWIGFRLTQDHRFQLLGDFKFFALENTGSPDPLPGESRSLRKYYEEQHASFEAHKAEFHKTGQVCRVDGKYEPRPVAALTELGGVAETGNMTWQDVPNAAFTYQVVSVDGAFDNAPRALDGRLYRFIATVPGWHYRESGADSILLYYDPVERIVLETFIFT